MAKVFGIHEIEVRSGMNEQEFERIATQDAFPALPLPDTRYYLLKRDRGTRNGRHLLVFEFTSVEARDRVAPTDDTLGAEAQRIVNAASGVLEQWAAYATPVGEAVYTDYVEVGTAQRARRPERTPKCIGRGPRDPGHWRLGHASLAPRARWIPLVGHAAIACDCST